MPLEDFMPTKRNSFSLTSGRLLIADPYELGYSELLLNTLTLHGFFEPRSNTRGSPTVTMLSCGLVLTTEANGGGWNAYREREHIQLTRTNFPENPHKPIMHVSQTSKYLLIGDAKKYCQPIEKRTVRGISKPSARKPLGGKLSAFDRQHDLQVEIYNGFLANINTNNEQVIRHPPGKIQCTTANRCATVQTLFKLVG